jgi:GTPase SAR1 family protein
MGPSCLTHDPMKAIKTTGSINEQGQIQLDRPLLGDYNRRVEVIILLSENLDLEVDGESKEEILSDLRQAWHEAMTGQTIPASQIWAGIAL